MNYETETSTGSLATTVRDGAEDQVRGGRDAAATRRALIRAARRRFATEGYRATTVRQIAGDAGVNVALINRYFLSKEGLFEACMLSTSDELGPQPPAGPSTLDDVIARLVMHAVRHPDSDNPLQLLLLLRSSGDEQADLVRRRTLERFTRGLATAAGWSADDPATDPILLRAQLSIATMLGVVALRTSASTEPIASADGDDLRGPLEEVFRVLLEGTDAGPARSRSRRTG